MAGEGRADRDLRGLEVARLADEDDVRVLPEEGAEGVGRTLIWTWLTPFRLYSTGSSTVMMFTSGELIVWIAE